MNQAGDDQQSNDPVSVVRRYCEAWMAGDTVTVVATYHDHLTLTWPGRHRLAGTHVGQQASIEALLNLQAATNREPVEIVDVMAGEHGVIAVVRERRGRVRDNGEPESIEVTRALDFTVRDAKLATCRIFELDQPAIDDWLGADDHAV